MKLTHRLLSLLLALALLCSLLPTAAFAVEDKPEAATQAEEESVEVPMEESTESATEEPADTLPEDSDAEEIVPAEETGEETASEEAMGAIVDSGTCGYGVNWTLDEAGVLTISGTGEMEDWIYEKNP